MKKTIDYPTFQHLRTIAIEYLKAYVEAINNKIPNTWNTIEADIYATYVESDADLIVQYIYESLNTINPSYQFKSGNCYQCKYRRSIPGTHHISCTCPSLYRKLNEHGVKNGWCFYPINFDPIWVEYCACFSKEVDPQ